MAALVAVVEPPAFVAVTTTRAVAPTSELERRYDGPLAPEIETQAPPPLSQSCHPYANDVGLPDHEPVVAERLLAACATPEIVGTVRFAGFGAGGAWVVEVSTRPLSGASVTLLTADPSGRMYVLPRAKVCEALGLGFTSTVPPL